MRKFRLLRASAGKSEGHELGGVYHEIDSNAYCICLTVPKGGYWWYYKRDLEEVFEGSTQASPDAFELYLEGMYEAFGGDAEGANIDEVNELLGKLLVKYRSLNVR